MRLDLEREHARILSHGVHKWNLGVVVRWLSQHRHEYLSEFQAIAEIQSIGTTKTAAE